MPLKRKGGTQLSVGKHCPGSASHSLSSSYGSQPGIWTEVGKRLYTHGHLCHGGCIRQECLQLQEQTTQFPAA